MKINTAEDSRIHILDSHSNVWSVIREIVDTNNQEDAFYICDIGDIVYKHKIWTAKLPRVKPHYGGYYFIVAKHVSIRYIIIKKFREFSNFTFLHISMMFPFLGLLNVFRECDVLKL